MDTITLERFSYAPDGTFGRMFFPNGKTLFTVERPWLGNKPYGSCIPEGVYALGKRQSPVVERTSKGKYVEGWEVLNVPQRTFIMVHPANWPFNVQGCIGVGLNYQILTDRSGIPRNAVSNSQDAFDIFMGIMDASDYWDLEIYTKRCEYP